MTNKFSSPIIFNIFISFGEKPVSLSIIILSPISEGKLGGKRNPKIGSTNFFFWLLEHQICKLQNLVEESEKREGSKESNFDFERCSPFGGGDD